MSVEMIVFGLLLLAGLVSMWAHGRGHSWAVAFLVSFFLSPVVGLIVYAILGNKHEKEAAKQLAEQERQREHERQLESLRAVTTTMKPTTPASTSGSLADELTKLAKLRDEGILTDEEFVAQKARLLASST